MTINILVLNITICTICQPFMNRGSILDFWSHHVKYKVSKEQPNDHSCTVWA